MTLKVALCEQTRYEIAHFAIAVTILNIIHRPVFCLKHNVSETGFCLLVQVEPTQLSPIDRSSPCLRPPADGERIQSQKQNDG
jgi:hypothetical protein